MISLMHVAILMQAEWARTEEQLRHANAQVHQRTTELQHEQVSVFLYTMS